MNVDKVDISILTTFRYNATKVAPVVTYDFDDGATNNYFSCLVAETKLVLTCG